MTVAPAFVQAIACAVADELERRGGTAKQTPYLDVHETAVYLHASRQRVYDLVSAGELRPCRDGRRLLFRREDIDAYLAGDQR